MYKIIKYLDDEQKQNMKYVSLTVASHCLFLYLHSLTAVVNLNVHRVFIILCSGGRPVSPLRLSFLWQHFYHYDRLAAN